MTDIQMIKLVGTIANLNVKELERLAHGLAWYTTGVSNKAEKLEFFLNVKIKEQNERMDGLQAWAHHRLKEMA